MLRCFVVRLASILLCLGVPARMSHAEPVPELPVHEPPVRAVDVFTDAHLLEIPPALADPPDSVIVLEDGFEDERLDGVWNVVGRVVRAQVTKMTSLDPGDRPIGRAKPVRPMKPVKTLEPAKPSESPLPPSLSSSPAPPPSAAAPPTVEITTDEAHGGRRSVRVASESSLVLPHLERRVAVKPRTTYRLRGFVRTEALEPTGAGASIELAELGDDPRGGMIVDHQHLTRERGTSVEWKTLEYTFQTSEATRHVRIVLRPATGRATGTAFFDDVTLMEIPPIAGVLGGAPFASSIRDAPPHPLLERRRFGHHDERPSILAPVPTRWRLRARLAEDTFLRFAVGAEANPAGPTKACFRILWRSDDVEAVPAEAVPAEAVPVEPLYDQCIEVADPSLQRNWRPRDIDLGSFAGVTGELVFETYGRDGELAFWGNPRLLDRVREPGDERPNIVLITVDTLRADHLGMAGYERPTSPVLDALAESSVRFAHAYATSPWTAPSLASLFTARYPSQHFGGVRIEREQREREPGQAEIHEAAHVKNRLLGELFRRATALRYHPIGLETETFVERLRAAGWDTVGFHSNFNSSGAVGLSRGFDRYKMFSGLSNSGAGGGVAMARRYLIEREEKSEDGPFFLLFHTQDPHVPYRLRHSLAETFDTMTEEEARKTNAFRSIGSWATEFWDWKSLRRGQAQGDVLERVVAFYDSEIRWADMALESLLQTVERWPNTLIVFTADHGEEFGEHGQYEHGHSLYDEVLRVPLLIRLPDGRHAGHVVDEPVSLVDVGPTILHLAGLEPLEEAEGRPLFAVGGERRRPRGGLFAEGMLRGPDRTGLVADGYKYVYTHPRGHLVPFPTERKLEIGITANTGHEELYRLDQDPDESVNLATRELDVLAALRRRVAAFLAETAHGVHVRCRAPEGLELEVATTESLAHVKPLYGVGEGDTFDLEGSRRRGVVRLASGDAREAWFLLRFFEPGGRLVLRTSSPGGRTHFFLGGDDKPAEKSVLTVDLGDEALLALPQGAPDTREPWCRVWQVEGAGPASSKALDSEIVDELRALGYL